MNFWGVLKFYFRSDFNPLKSIYVNKSEKKIIIMLLTIFKKYILFTIEIIIITFYFITIVRIVSPVVLFTRKDKLVPSY